MKKKRTPFYTRGNHPTVTPKTAPQRAVLPQVAAVLPLDPAVLPLPLAVLPPRLGGLEERAGNVPSAVLPPVTPKRYYCWVPRYYR